MSNKLVQMARELLAIDDDIVMRFDFTTDNHPTCDDFDLIVFEQTWGSTALGFGGCGGQQITAATTYVFIPITCNQKCFVYFAGRFAYAVPYSQTFMDDVRMRCVEGVSTRWKYLKKGVMTEVKTHD